nr:unnamed protein product [Callosobruchus analis]
MYVPGDDTRKINKAVGLDVDFIALDCEDGVALNRKEDARKMIHQFLNDSSSKDIKGDLGVRVNSIDTGLCKDDLTSCLSTKTIPDTILLPKVESTQELNWVSRNTVSAKDHCVPEMSIINRLNVSNRSFIIESCV